MTAPRLFEVHYIHIMSQQTGHWEIYAESHTEAIKTANELFPDSYKLTNIHLKPMFDD